MESMLDSIRAAVAPDATPERRAAGAVACRTFLAAIEGRLEATTLAGASPPAVGGALAVAPLAPMTQPAPAPPAAGAPSPPAASSSSPRDTSPATTSSSASSSGRSDLQGERALAPAAAPATNSPAASSPRETLPATTVRGELGAAAVPMPPSAPSAAAPMPPPPPRPAAAAPAPAAPAPAAHAAPIAPAPAALAPPPMRAPVAPAQGPLPPIASAVAALRSMPVEQMLDLFIARLQAAVTARESAPRQPPPMYVGPYSAYQLPPGWRPASPQLSPGSAMTSQPPPPQAVGAVGAQQGQPQPQQPPNQGSQPVKFAMVPVPRVPAPRVPASKDRR